MTNPTQPENGENQSYLNSTWLLKLRWVAVVGQMVTIAGSVLFFQTHIPMAWAMGVVISVTAISNLFLTFWFRLWKRFGDQSNSVSAPVPDDLVLGLVMVMDMLSLTALLFTTGGPNNPFCLFFFVNLSLAALLVNRLWAWAINGLTIVCFAGLMLNHHQLDQLDLGLDPIRRQEDITLNHLGMIVAFATCASVIVYFMTRLTEALRSQQQEVRRAQALQANSEKIEALGTLAAGTAHELATPLSTIAVVARDVEQAFEKHPPDFPGAEDVIEDVHLIRSQLDRCRGILDQMSSHAGEAIGEAIEPASIKQISTACLDGLMGRGRVQISLPKSAESETLDVPLVGLSQAMRGIVQNALDADPSDRAVTVDVVREDDVWNWKIRDQGPGMSSEQLSRVSEPFYTTKSPGQGMGLGVFLAKNVLRRIGGEITFESEVGKGTCVTVSLPVSRNHV